MHEITEFTNSFENFVFHVNAKRIWIKMLFLFNQCLPISKNSLEDVALVAKLYKCGFIHKKFTYF